MPVKAYRYNARRSCWTLPVPVESTVPVVFEKVKDFKSTRAGTGTVTVPNVNAKANFAGNATGTVAGPNTTGNAIGTTHIINVTGTLFLPLRTGTVDHGTIF